MSHARYFAAMMEDYETYIDDWAYFLRFSISDDASKFYDTIIQQKNPWNAILAASKLRYSSAYQEA